MIRIDRTKALSCGLTFAMISAVCATGFTNPTFGTSDADSYAINIANDSRFSAVNLVQNDEFEDYYIPISTVRCSQETKNKTYLMYVDCDAAIYRSEPIINEETKLGKLTSGEEIEVVEQEGQWCKCVVDDKEVYIYAELLTEEYTLDEIKHEVIQVNQSAERKDAAITSDTLTSTLGRVQGPSGEETYYNLNMSGVVSRLHDLGYEGEYWVRKDGVKMFGDYVLVAANFNIRPIGTVLETSLGTGIVADTGDFVEDHPYLLDIAVTW